MAHDSSASLKQPSTSSDLPSPPADASGHVPVRASERRRAGAAARGLHLHVSSGAEHCQWGLGVWDLAGHGAVWPAAWELHQPCRRVWHMGRSWVRMKKNSVNPLCKPAEWLYVSDWQLSLLPQLCLSIYLWPACGGAFIWRTAEWQSARHSYGFFQFRWTLSSFTGLFD